MRDRDLRVGSFVDAKRSGDGAAVEEAQVALASARDWPILQEMAAHGGCPGVVWQIADDVVADRFPTGYRQGLGGE